MAEVKLSALTAATGLTDDDEFYVNDGGTSKRLTATNAKTYMQGGLVIGTDVQAHSAVLDATTASFLTADKTKLAGIEPAATADQTGAQIKVAYEAEADTNAYDDAAVSKLAGIEPAADVTDAVNVAAAGAPIITSGAGPPASTPAAVGDIYVDTTNENVWSAAGTASSADWKQATGGGGGDLLAANNLSDVANAGTARTNLGLVIGTDVQAHSAVLDATTASFLIADETKLDGIEPAADVTDTANVAAAGALMDSEVDADIKTLTLPASTTISAFGATLVDDADAATALATLGAVADFVAPVEVTGTTDTLAAADHGVTNYYSNASAVTVTIPTDASDDLADGFWCLLVSTGAGGLTLSTTGVTLLGSSPNTTIAQNEGMLVQKTATANTWIVLGGTAA